MQTIRITTSQNIDIDYEVSGVADRIAARLIDMAVFIVVFVLGLIGFTIIGPKTDVRFVIILLIIIYASLFVFYDLVCEIVMNGQSVGKRIMKIKVISLDGARASLGQYLLRWLFRIVDFTLTSQLCGLICIIVSDKKQRVGDMVAGTTVIKTKPRILISNIDFTPVADDYEPQFEQVTQLKEKDIIVLQEVIRNYFETGNSVVVYNAAARIKELLSLKSPTGMDDLAFLQTIVKDFTHLNTVNG